MHAKTPTAAALEEVRRDIDAVDNGLLDLLAQRVALSERVRALKQPQDGAPLRPAREAVLYERLLGKGRGLGLKDELLVRLWRTIIADSSLRQSPVSVIVGARLAADVPSRLHIAEAFPLIPVKTAAGEAEVLAEVDRDPASLGIVAAESAWLGTFLGTAARKARVVATLRPPGSEPQAPFLVIAQALSEPTRNDETLVSTRGSLPREFALRPVWQIDNQGYHVSALPGFLSEKEAPLMGLIRANPGLGLKVLGRYPSPRF